MPTTVFAPAQPATALARAVTAPSGNIYTLNGAGVCVSADVDTPWFLMQGFVAQPTAALYAPFEGIRAMPRQITNPNTGNSFVFNSAGFATGITGADLAWFLNQGFVQVPAGTVVVKPGTGRMAGRITNPATGNSYTVNGRGFVVTQAADLPWFYSQGYSPVAAGTLLAADEEVPKAKDEEMPDEEPPKPKRK
jgi:hypothetical protein